MKESLQQLVDRTNPVDLLRNSQAQAQIHHVEPTAQPSWIRVQQAVREAVVLYDQTHHLNDVYIGGSDAIKLLSDTGVNSLKGFRSAKPEHFVAASTSGHLVGEGILFREDNDAFLLVGRAPVANWLGFHGQHGGYRNLDISVDRRPDVRDFGCTPERRSYRFELQGPRAWDVAEKLNGGPLEDVPFIHTSTMTIAGKTVRTLRHRMAGFDGLELWGPYTDHDKIRDAILEAGIEFDLLPAGSRAYPASTLKYAWIPAPLPAIYTGESERPYREWLDSDSYEATGTLAGSFVADDIEDYYLTPWALGYESVIAYDHDFIGRNALERLDPGTQRRKATLAWNSEDLTRIWASQANVAGPRYKFFDLPIANYGSSQYDAVVDADGTLVGFAMFTGFSANEGRGISFATIDPDVPAGAELTLIWGEPAAGTKKNSVEHHEQIEVRVVLGTVPYTHVEPRTDPGGWRRRQTPQ